LHKSDYFNLNKTKNRWAAGALPQTLNINTQLMLLSL